MFDDPHLNAKGGLLDMEMEDGGRCKLPALPISLDGQRFRLHLDPPKAGEHTEELLTKLGLDIPKLKSKGVISSWRSMPKALERVERVIKSID